MKVGIIGFGRLGSLLTHYLAQDSDLMVYERADKNMLIKQAGGKPVSLEQLNECPIVISCVPMSSFEESLHEVKDVLQEDALFIDTCSVKEKPVEQMTRILPKHVSILGTHPMFGPDSAGQTLYGSKIVLCPARIEHRRFRNIKNYLSIHGLKVVEASPTQHDQEISHSLILTHFIGRALMEINAHALDIDTKGYRRLMKILETVENDSWELFRDMNNLNPYSENMRKEFIEALSKVQKRIEE